MQCQTQIAQEKKIIISKQYLLTLRSFWKVKQTANQVNGQPTEWEKIFWQLCIDKGLIARIHKELKKLNIKTVDNPIKNDY